MYTFFCIRTGITTKFYIAYTHVNRKELYNVMLFTRDKYAWPAETCVRGDSCLPAAWSQ